LSLHPEKFESMSQSGSKRLGRNIVLNCTGMGVEAVAAFILAPFLIGRLGEQTYGLWIVLGSLTSYVGLLDLGLRGSVGRFVALHHAKGDQEAVNQTVSSACAVLLGTGVVAILGVLALLPAFFWLFDVPAGQVDTARWALVIIAINLGLSFLTNAFDATLWGLQRFDLLNLVDIPATLTRAGLTLLLVGHNSGLVTLALVTLGVTVGCGLSKAALSFRACRGLHLGFGKVKRGTIREIFGYGIWNFIASITRITRAQLSPLLIGALLGVSLVTPFAIAARLIAYVGLFLQSATGVFTPLATSHHARNDRERQQRLFIVGGRFCLALSLFFLALLLLLGGPLLGLWVSPVSERATPLLLILALGELLPNAQFVTNGIILASARHRPLAWLNVLETVAVAGLTILLLPVLGLSGACWAIAVPGAVCRGVGQLVQGCRITEVSFARYVTRAVLPALACAAVPTLALGVAVSWHSPDSWGQLIVYGGVFSLLFATCGVFLIGPALLRKLVSRLRARTALVPARPA
jgi:O-antigen/teichoic acid export membrane protein